MDKLNTNKITIRSPDEDWNYLVEQINSNDKIELNQEVYLYFFSMSPRGQKFDKQFTYVNSKKEDILFTKEGYKYYAKRR